MGLSSNLDGAFEGVAYVNSKRIHRKRTNRFNRQGAKGMGFPDLHNVKRTTDNRQPVNG